MNTLLTSNMLIEQGDEYLHEGKWQPVTENHIGLQVYFAPSQIRRPSPLSAAPVLADPASEEAGEARECTVSKARETVGDATTDTTTRGGTQPIPVTYQGAGTHLDIINKKPISSRLKGGTEKDKIPAPSPSGAGTPPSIITIPFDMTTGETWAWTGRNGTFNGKAIELCSAYGGTMIRVFPVGKRGVGNCLISFPTSIIPQMVDWLLRQQTTT